MTSQSSDQCRRRRVPVLVALAGVGPAAWGACSLVQPPLTPDPSYLGCYRLWTDLPASYADSLGYELPELIQLGFSEGGQWTVLPTDADWHPGWGAYDGLPSGHVRRGEGYARTSPLQWDSVDRIPGDSIDVVFPSAIGRLYLRLGRDGDRMGGRAEWVVREDRYFLNEGVRVEAIPSSCEGLAVSLRRTRNR